MRKQIILLSILTSLAAPAALARDDSAFRSATPPITLAASKGGAEQIEVESIKEKYWARGDNAEVGVVQNRIYTKARRVQLGFFGGVLLSDPFLNTTDAGASLGFHLDETYSINLVGWKSFVRDSSALEAFKEFSGATSNTNPTRSFLGLEATGSLLYGKLSLVGRSIIHYDMHLSLGVGRQSTDNGAYLAPNIGIGQRFYVSKRASIRFDYRLIYYRETIVEKVVPTKLGEVKGPRDNFTNSLSIGVDFMFGGDHEEEKR